LDLLNQRGTKATFFVLTDKIIVGDPLIRRMIAEGHEVGLHSDRHDRLTRLPAAVVRRRLAKAKSRLQSETGVPVRLFRPPFGAQSIITYAIARANRMDVIVWTSNAQDWIEAPAEVAANKALSSTQGGDILLLHDGLELPSDEQIPTFDRVKMVEHILDGFGARRLRGVTVGELIAKAGYARTCWFVK
jgi:peptidoglycan/xylan/chitin deacetylase (PgdA/CDA1 family)